mmetsp:Transcript_14106/g.47605  ORF Transcript_14106/g.47605 Transcript_14106/m.47605 type:complete len:429 (+) Transcript_14106:91-1377(+)
MLSLRPLVHFSVTLGLGWFIVELCRSCTKRYSMSGDWRLVLVPLASPAVVFLAVYTAFAAGMCSKVVADAVCLGMLAGVVGRLVASDRAPRVSPSAYPSSSSSAAAAAAAACRPAGPRASGGGVVKLTVRSEELGRMEVWLDGEDVTAGVAREKIAELLSTQAVRVHMESGDGRVVEADSAPLLDQLAPARPDFLGFLSAACFVREMEPPVVDRDELDDDHEGPGILLPFAYPLMITATGEDSGGERTFFIVSKIGYAAAALVAPEDGVCIRLFKALRKQDTQTVELDKTAVRGVENGDQVVIECNEKFMSVYRGWWVAWTAKEPKRSGMFRVELLDRPGADEGPQGAETLRDSFRKSRSTLRGVEVHPGEEFRLRSVKFPAFELGVTRESIDSSSAERYLGLRKVAEDDSTAETWLCRVRFSLQLRH